MNARRNLATPLVGRLEEDGGIKSTRLWRVLRRFFVLAGDAVQNVEPVTAEKLRGGASRNPKRSGIVVRNVNRISVGLCLAVAVSSAQAEHWVAVAKNNKETVYLDGDSIKREENGNVLVWTKHDLSAHPMIVDNRPIATSLERDAFDCSRDRVRSLSTVAYDRNGTLLAAIDSPSTFNEIPPGTVIASIEQVACGAAKRLGM
jgi:hypothetical protein